MDQIIFYTNARTCLILLLVSLKRFVPIGLSLTDFLLVSAKGTRNRLQNILLAVRDEHG